MCHLGTMHTWSKFHGNSSKDCQDISPNTKMSTWHWIWKTIPGWWCVCGFHANPSSHKVEGFQRGPTSWTDLQIWENDGMMIKRQEKFNLDTTAQLGRKVQFGIVSTKIPKRGSQPEKHRGAVKMGSVLGKMLTCVSELAEYSRWIFDGWISPSYLHFHTAGRRLRLPSGAGTKRRSRTHLCLCLTRSFWLASLGFRLYGKMFDLMS